MSFYWEADPEAVFAAMTAAYLHEIRQAVYGVLLSYAPRIESWLKDNAAWTDRTGNLRQSLTSWAESTADALVLKLDYGLDYGVFLELANGGAYAIIAPALDHFAPQIWRDIERLFA